MTSQINQAATYNMRYPSQLISGHLNARQRTFLALDPGFAVVFERGFAAA
jgi:hypothetical protein